MNRNAILFVLAFAASLVWSGCNKAGKLSEKSKSGPPSGPVQLKQKWPKGEQIVKHMDMKMDMEINVPGQPNPIKQTAVMGQKYGLNVVEEDGNGGHEVDMEFLGMSMKVDQAGRTVVEYDSEKKAEASKDRNIVAMQKMFDGIVGTKLQYYLNATNGVDRVDGIEKMISNLSSGGPAAQNSGIKNMFNDAYLREMLGDSRYLPPNPVQPSDTWPIQFDLSLGEMGELSINYNVTFTKWEQHGPRWCARMEFDGTMKGKPVKESTSNQMSMNIDNGTTSGVSWFDPEIGAIIDSDLNQDMAITMNITIPARGGAKPAKQSMKMQMHQVLNVKLDSVK